MPTLGLKENAGFGRPMGLVPAGRQKPAAGKTAIDRKARPFGRQVAVPRT
jgi:hypothetical protein